MNIVETTEYDFLSSFLDIGMIILVVLEHLLPIIILLFIARVLWLIYKIEKRKYNEKR